MTDAWTIALADEAATIRLGSDLAPSLRAGDTVALHGGLGAGKTTLARAIVRAVAGQPALEVPSPTFTLVQTYALDRVDIAHFDLYRIEHGEEVAELGLDDALETGVALIEWPERLDDLAPDRLDITLEEDGPDRRLARLVGHGAWSARLDRLRRLEAFLETAGWGGCRRRFLQGDASSRRYERIDRDGRHAVLMDMPRRPDGPPIRGGRPYSAIAHLAESAGPFVAIAGALRDLGLSAPEIFAADPDDGFLVIEDLGDAVYERMVADGADMDGPYAAAVDVLAALRRTAGIACAGSWRLPSYDREALAVEAGLVPDWLWPQVHGEPAPADARSAFTAAWDDLFAIAEAGERIWTLRDYHSPNLVWLPERPGLARVGLLDFQDALLGHPAYDLVSLLQDARVDVSTGRETAMVRRYCDRAAADGAFDEPAFRAAYAVLGAQRASKILGIFVRLARRDGKTGYLRHIPRVSRYLERNLAHPALAGLRAWYDRHLPAPVRERT